jgi:L-arabinose isomerase
MDFMNLNQSAHGDREFGFITTRMSLPRKVIVGFWQDPSVAAELACWLRAAAAWHDWQKLRIARFGDNMRSVAVTEGDKTEAELRLGFSVNSYGVGDLAASVREVTDADIDTLVSEYEQTYNVAKALQRNGDQWESIREAARLELGLRHFLQAGGFAAFTDTFEDLHGLAQLPGVAVQRLMAEGYGFGAEGDWKTAALVRAMKVMSAGLSGGTSFMEDYTYHFRNAGQVLGAHMLEICPSIAVCRPSLEIHPLSIGGKADPVRLVFDAATGPAINASLIDLGHRFRIVLNQVQVISPEGPLPRLPVARAVWIPEPDLKTAAHAWILAGGAHHTGFSLALTAQHIEDFAQIGKLEFLLIDRNTIIRGFQQELRHNEAYYGLAARC